ncbi:hypothetical protein CYY_000054 [Polysphondylium violaceum]|uniref:IPT/TIG domain-containing protein n=1 Tax=Polysphondylium violaceum TaxID=133409 RepID=A0A8J4Q2D5_9MYCE|nr:hypothetical protein CYY_000054 [Polysphondylium violaceum]
MVKSNVFLSVLLLVVFLVNASIQFDRWTYLKYVNTPNTLVTGTGYSYSRLYIKTGNTMVFIIKNNVIQTTFETSNDFSNVVYYDILPDIGFSVSKGDVSYTITNPALSDEGIVAAYTPVFSKVAFKNANTIPGPEGSLVYGGDNMAAFIYNMPYYLSIWDRATQGVKSNSFEIPQTPTNLICDWNVTTQKCFVVCQGKFLTYQVQNLSPPDLILNLDTSDVVVRSKSAINSVQQIIYYCVEDSVSGSVFLEARSYLGDVLFKRILGSLSINIKCLDVKVDANEGQVFVLTAVGGLYSYDFMGNNPYAVLMGPSTVSLELISFASINYLALFYTNTISVYRYYGACKESCLGAGTCSYGVCTCNEAYKNSFCGDYPVIDTIAVELQENGTLVWTISGDFPAVEENKSMMVSIYSIFPTESMTGPYNSTTITIKPTYFIKDGILEVEINDKSSAYPNPSETLYPVASIDSYVQDGKIIYFIGENFANIYQYTFTIESTVFQAQRINNTFISIESVDFPPQATLGYNATTTIDTIQLQLRPFIDFHSDPSSDNGETIEISGYFFGESPYVYIDDKKIPVVNGEFVLPIGIYPTAILGNGLVNITFTLEYPEPTISNVVHVSDDLLKLTGSNFGNDPYAIGITLSGYTLDIQTLDHSTGELNIYLVQGVYKGLLTLEVKDQSASHIVNLKPVLESITPTKPTYDGQVITITGKYLKDAIITHKSNQVSTNLQCTQVSTEKVTCQIIEGTGSFNLTATSLRLEQSDTDLESNTLTSEYTIKPTPSPTPSSTPSTTPSTPSTSSSSSSSVEEPNSSNTLSINMINICILISFLLLMIN